MIGRQERRPRASLAWWGLLAPVTVLGFLDVSRSYDEALDVIPLQIALAGSLVLWWLVDHRQRPPLHPLTVLPFVVSSIAFTAVCVFSGLVLPDYRAFYSDRTWGLTETFGLLLVLFAVSRRSAGRSAVAAVITVGLTTAILPLRSGVDRLSMIFALLLALGAAAVIAAGVYFRVIADNRERALVTARAEQRAEFARDLHDYVTHHVTGIIVQAQGARIIAAHDLPRAVLALEHIEGAAAATMASMRRMVGVLRDPDAPPDAPLAPLAGVADIGPLLAGFGGPGGPAARLHSDGDLTGVPVEVSTTAYRVVMEALTNIRRHAVDAQIVGVWLARTAERLTVRVVNDGVAPRDAGLRTDLGYGLMGLTERVAALGGRITAGPRPDGGWCIDATLPWTVEETP